MVEWNLWQGKTGETPRKTYPDSCFVNHEIQMEWPTSELGTPRPPLWARRQHAHLSCSGPGFDTRSEQVSWVWFFRGFSSLVRQISGNFRPQGPRISFGHHYPYGVIIHYGRQWPEMLTRPKTSNILGTPPAVGGECLTVCVTEHLTSNKFKFNRKMKWNNYLISD